MKIDWLLPFVTFQMACVLTHEFFFEKKSLHSNTSVGAHMTCNWSNFIIWSLHTFCLLFLGCYSYIGGAPQHCFYHWLISQYFSELIGQRSHIIALSDLFSQIFKFDLYRSAFLDICLRPFAKTLGLSFLLRLIWRSEVSVSQVSVPFVAPQSWFPELCALIHTFWKA